MDFNFEIEKKNPPIVTTIHIPVSEDVKFEVTKIKRISPEKAKLVNNLGRQFFEQLIEKFKAGEFDEAG